VTRAKGKALLSGGYGVTVTTTIDHSNNNNDDEEKEKAAPKEKETTKGTIDATTTATDVVAAKKRKSDDLLANENLDSEDDNDNDDEEVEKKSSAVYLFLEEVLCLHEQGLLQCYEAKNDNACSFAGTLQEETVADDGNDKKSHQPPPHKKGLSSPQLYALLEPFGLSMASYLVYAHLRQQTFRVVRFTSNRLSLLDQLHNFTTTDTSQDIDPPPPPPQQQQQEGRRSLQLELRRDVQLAPPPMMIHHDNDADVPPAFAFCVYKPDSQFSKSNPGLPAFLVAITSYGQSDLNFDTLLTLLSLAQGIPIKVATVADSGTVVMFGVTNVGVPSLV